MIESKGSPTYAVETIDPHTAKDILGANTHNRNLRFRVVDSYAADMATGSWQENGDSIKIATDGTLLDGQHRLHAIVESGTTQRMLVVRNLPMSAQDVVDTGAKRTFSDVLKLRKEVNYNAIASVTRRVHLWQRGLRTLKGGSYVPTNTQLLLTLEQHPDIRLSAEVGVSVNGHIPVYVSTAGLSHWVFSHLSTQDEEALQEDVQVFFDRLKDGADLAASHPISVLRRTAVDVATSKSRLDEVVMTAYVIKAWNAYREGRSMGLLRYRVGGANPEVFPEPK